MQAISLVHLDNTTTYRELAMQAIYLVHLDNATLYRYLAMQAISLDNPFGRASNIPDPFGQSNSNRYLSMQALSQVHLDNTTLNSTLACKQYPWSICNAITDTLPWTIWTTQLLTDTLAWHVISLVHLDNTTTQQIPCHASNIPCPFE